MSDSESICSPKALCVLVMRATAVKAVEHHGAEHACSSQFEAAVHGHHDGVEATEQRSQREQVGQDVDTLAALAHHHALNLVGLIVVLHQSSLQHSAYGRGQLLKR